MMKKFLVVLSIIMTFGFKAQLLPLPIGVIPIESMENRQTDLPDGAYIKDVHHLLDKYEGTWEGSFNNKSYKIVIDKATFHYSKMKFKEDLLLLRHKITDATGQVVINTLNLANDANLVVKGNQIKSGGTSGEYYILGYWGEEAKCNQKGTIYIYFVGNNTNHLKLFLKPSIHHFRSTDCPNGAAQQLFPTSSHNPLYLTKQ